ncbi:MAG TPA: MoaD/ThiS family protein [Gemmataceae bacterium]|nr:MoaD/ThiS family protein [Gemmataceae bacterium]
MATVYIPALLRDLTAGLDIVTVEGATVQHVIEQLDRLYPGIKNRLCDGDALRPGMAAAVDTQLASKGLLQAVGPTSEVHFLPAIAGGAN